MIKNLKINSITYSWGVIRLTIGDYFCVFLETQIGWEGERKKSEKYEKLREDTDVNLAKK